LALSSWHGAAAGSPGEVPDRDLRSAEKGNKSLRRR
jgi:hypothetical protein